MTATLVALLPGGLLAGCGDEGPATTSRGAGVVGVVRLGPRCPVETPTLHCGPGPAAGARVAVTRQRSAPGTSGVGGGDAVASGATDRNGRFRIALRPGTWVVTSDAGMSCTPARVRVEPGRYTRVEIDCDSGIR